MTQLRRPQILPQPRHCCSSKIAADTAAAETLATGDAAEKAAASSGTAGTCDAGLSVP
jgi:hypothetical protein